MYREAVSSLRIVFCHFAQAEVVGGKDLGKNIEEDHKECLKTLKVPC